MWPSRFPLQLIKAIQTGDGNVSIYFNRRLTPDELTAVVDQVKRELGARQQPMAEALGEG